ncbi:MAG: hypothetical protein ACLVCH_09045 [Roseburia inulinivorans]
MKYFPTIVFQLAQRTGDENNGVVLLPERLVFTADNMDDYDF